MDRSVAAGDLTTARADGGTTLTARTEKPDEITVTLRYDKAGKLTTAEVAQGAGRKGATLTLGDKGAGTMKRGGITDFYKDLPENPVVATGPEWIDALQLIRRYDGAKGGKQEFAGLSLEPAQGLQKQTFSAERQEADTVMVKEKELKLDRYRLKLRGGDYAAWADAEGRVVRVQGLAAKAVPVVLEGFEDATRGLKP
jgi:YD repeat-containing protein